MKTTIWYSVQNCGDGSAYPEWFESKELAVLDQKFMDEGWSEACVGSLEIKHEGPIKFSNVIFTAEMVKKNLEEEIKEGEEYYDADRISKMEKHLEKVEELIAKKK